MLNEIDIWMALKCEVLSHSPEQAGMYHHLCGITAVLQKTSHSGGFWRNGCNIRLIILHVANYGPLMEHILSFSAFYWLIYTNH